MKKITFKLVLLTVLVTGIFSAFPRSTYATTTCEIVPGFIADYFNCSDGDVGTDFCFDAQVAAQQCIAQFPLDGSLSNWEAYSACRAASGIDQCQ